MNAPTAQAIASLTIAAQRLRVAIEDGDMLRRAPPKQTRLGVIAAEQISDAEMIDCEAIIRDTESIARRASVRARQLEKLNDAMREEAKAMP